MTWIKQTRIRCTFLLQLAGDGGRGPNEGGLGGFSGRETSIEERDSE